MRSVWRRARRAPAGDDRGQTLVEFALIVPFFFFTVLVAIQFALYMGEYYNVMQVARETARWVSINPNTTDSAILTYARTQTRPGMISNNITLTATPACASLDSFGRCTNRTTNTPLYLDVSYDVSHVIFLPTTFKLGRLTAAIPTNMPAYRVAVPTE